MSAACRHIREIQHVCIYLPPTLQETTCVSIKHAQARGRKDSIWQILPLLATLACQKLAQYAAPFWTAVRKKCGTILQAECRHWRSNHLRSVYSLSMTLHQIFPGLKRPRCDVDHVPLPSTEIKERVELYTYPFRASMGSYGAKFTFTFTPPNDVTCLTHAVNCRYFKLLT